MPDLKWSGFPIGFTTSQQSHMDHHLVVGRRPHGDDMHPTQKTNVRQSTNHGCTTVKTFIMLVLMLPTLSILGWATVWSTRLAKNRHPVVIAAEGTMTHGNISGKSRLTETRLSPSLSKESDAISAQQVTQHTFTKHRSSRQDQHAERDVE